MSVPLPPVRPTPLNAFFWQGARAGRLLIQQCSLCGRYQHPPLPACAACGSGDVAASAVCGRGQVDSFTVIRRAFHPAFAERLPYVVARIVLEEQQDLVLVTNVIDCPPDAVRIGMPVVVRFEVREDSVLPQFAPEAAA